MKLLENFDNIYYSFGLSPNDIKERDSKLTPDDIEKLFTKAIQQKNNKIIGIGEIGLDYFHNFAPPDLQKKIFKLQIELAKKYKLPVIIHTREAFNDTFELLKDFKENIIFHCFSGTKNEVKYALKNLASPYFSFAGNLTFNKARKLQEAITYVPHDRLLFETDSPYLTPVPHRGKRNYPYYVIYTYKFAAKLLNMDLEKLQHIVFSNVENAFNIKLKI